MRTYQTRPIQRLSFDLTNKKIDIIIPFYGGYEHVLQLMKQIWYTVKSNKYRIMLVDDGSRNKDFIKAFERAPYTKIVQNEEQEGFGAALHRGFNESDNEFVLFMHSDVYIEEPNWCIELLKSYLIMETQGVGLVSARSDNPGEDSPKALKGESKSRDKDVILKEGFVPLYCALCRRDLFGQIGGFIKHYPYGYYEDEELAYRMRKKRIAQGISGGSWVGHRGGMTFNVLNKKIPNFTEIINKNYEQMKRDMA